MLFAVSICYFLHVIINISVNCSFVHLNLLHHLLPSVVIRIVFVIKQTLAINAVPRVDYFQMEKFLCITIQNQTDFLCQVISNTSFSFNFG